MMSDPARAMAISSWWPALRRKCRSARHQRWAVLALTPLAWLAIGMAALLIAWLPFRRIAPWLGRNLGAVALAPLAPPPAVRRAHTIGSAIAIAARNAPFRSDCLPQALAAAALCRCGRVPYAMHLGAAIRDGALEMPLSAHAWVQCGPLTVTGGADAHRRNRAVACFTG